MKCGKAVPGGCPAYTKGLGRVCWLVEGTQCEENHALARGPKIERCAACAYYKLVELRAEAVAVEIDGGAAAPSSKLERAEDWLGRLMNTRKC